MHFQNLASILSNREISSKINHKAAIELLLESSYFTNSDVKHIAEDFPLNESGILLPCQNESVLVEIIL